MLKRLAYSAGDLGLITGSGKSSGEGNGTCKAFRKTGGGIRELLSEKITFDWD